MQIASCKTLILSVCTLVYAYSICPSAHGQQDHSSVLIENVTLIDGTGRPPLSNAFVLILGNKIAEVSTCPIEVPAQTRRINGHGKYLIPGLMDVHIHLEGGTESTVPDEHLGIRRLHSYLYSGVTSVLDVGNNADFIFALREKERSGQIVSPRIFAAGGEVTYPGSHDSGPFATLIEKWPEARPTLDAAIRRQPDMLKIVYDEHGWGNRPLLSLMPLDLLSKVVEYYNDHGIRSIVHIASELRAREAIFAGADALAHPPVTSPISDDFARLMAAKRIAMTSTLAAGDRRSRLAEHPEFLDQSIYRAVLDSEEIQHLKTEESLRQQKDPFAKWWKLMTPIAEANVAKINAAGGFVALGSDLSLGPDSLRELELLVEAGITPTDAIRIGTLDGAIVLGKSRELGSVQTGKLADLVLLNANPLTNIENITQIDVVIKDGQVIDRSKLDLPVNHRQ